MAKQQLTWTNEKRKLRDLAPWEHNPRYIKDAQAERLLESFNEFGQVLPICIGPDGEIYDGHQRRSVIGAADEYGLDYEIDVRVASRKLSERERQKLTVYLHQGATGQWDWDALADSFDFDDLVLWGFDEDQLLGMGWTEPEEETEASDAEAQISRADELQAQWQTATGQLWRIGEHRLICGDCTDPRIVERVMGGEKADMMFTDPPYNVSYVGKTKDALIIDNDSMSDDDFFDFLCSFMGIAPLQAGKVFYVCSPPGNPETVFRNAINTVSGWMLKQCIVWVKDQFVMGRQDYHWRHESILYGWVDGAAHYFVDDRTQDTVWEIDRPKVNAEHPTMKPIEVPLRGIRNNSKPGDLVYEPFAGSGTTIVACENLQRKCRAVEISPSYCAVILQRMQDAFPSIEIELLS